MDKASPSPALTAYLHEMVLQGATDLHIAPESPPQIRVCGQLRPLDLPPLPGVEIKDMVCSILHNQQQIRFENEREIHCSFEVEGLARFRASLFHQRGAVGAVFRVIPLKKKSFQDLALPPVVQSLCDFRSGLVLIVGPSGSGKSTTLAAMVDWINSEKHLHIITIEDPIEHVHVNKKSIVSQREIHTDTISYVRALHAAQTEDPDVVLVGEIQDSDTAEIVFGVAEKGHLVLASTPAVSATDAILAMIEMFPPLQQPRARARLASSLIGVVAQVLVDRADGKGKVAALEVLNQTPALKNLIREDKIHQIYSMMQATQKRTGMQTFNQSLANLFSQNAITAEVALRASPVPEELNDIIRRGTGPAGIR